MTAEAPTPGVHPPGGAGERLLSGALLRGGMWVVLGKIVTATSTLAIGKLVANLVSKPEAGAYQLTFALVTGFVFLAHLGLQQAIVRLVAESQARGDGARTRAAVGTVFRTAAVGAIVVGALLAFGGMRWVAEWQQEPLLLTVGPLVALWVMLSAFQILNSEAFRGFKDLRGATLFGGVIAGLVTTCILAFYYLFQRDSASFTTLFWATLAGFAASIAFAAPALARRVRALPTGGSVTTGEVLALSSPMWINFITTYLLLMSDRLIIGRFFGDGAASDYLHAARLVAVVSTSLQLVNLVVQPYIADLYTRGEKRRLERMLRVAASVAGIPAFLALGGFLLAGEWVLELAYKEEYRTAAPILVVLSVGKLFNVLTGSCGVMMNLTGHHKVLMRITIVTTLLVVTGGWFAAQQWGVLAVAWVYTLGTVVQNVWMWLENRYRTGVWTHVGLPNREELRTLTQRFR